MKVVDAIARILKLEGTEFLSDDQGRHPARALPPGARGVSIADGYARVKNGKTLASMASEIVCAGGLLWPIRGMTRRTASASRAVRMR